MTFPEIVKTILWDIIDEMSRSLSSFVKNPNKDFLRPKTESIYQNKNILNKLQSQKAL